MWVNQRNNNFRHARCLVIYVFKYNQCKFFLQSLPFLIIERANRHVSDYISSLLCDCSCVKVENTKGTHYTYDSDAQQRWHGVFESVMQKKSQHHWLYIHEGMVASSGWRTYNYYCKLNGKIHGNNVPSLL